MAASGIHPNGSHLSVDNSNPVATNSVLNKSATAASSLYQNCLSVRERLARVPGFAESFLDLSNENIVPATSPTTAIPNDPVSQICHVLRLGSSLCYLFNVLGLPRELEVNPDANRSNLKACQRSAAHFIMACRQDLGWDDLFTVTQLYEQDTNGTVKVIKVVTKLLDELERRGLLDEPEIVPEVEQVALGALDDRAKVVREILESERSYVTHLEILQDYQRQLTENDIVGGDTIHSIFLNLNTLVDFQRRFLIGVEANASMLPQEQHFGHLFCSMEELFSCYEAFCANVGQASEIVQAESAALSKMSHILDNNYELPSLLIKPVARICKYPLLLQQLIKMTDKSFPYYQEQLNGLDSIKRVTDRVNETKRRQENAEAVRELERRVEDWKGHDIATFGQLLLESTFMVIKNDSEREYHVYLFEKIILCCKETGKENKKNSKSNSILKRPNSSNKRKTALLLKGRIFINNVISAVAMQKPGTYLLQVTWRGDVAEEAFSIKCLNEETQRQWQKAVTKAVEESAAQRRSKSALSRRLASPHSAFPNTPQSDFASPGGYMHYPSMSSTASTPGIYPNANMFDDEDHELSYMNAAAEHDMNASGRSTPSRRPPGTTQSLPPHLRDNAAIHQWRSQTPSLPPMPRPQLGSQHSSEMSMRSQSSSGRPLRNKASQEWSSQASSASLNRMNQSYDDVSGMPGYGPRVHKQPSQASLAHTAMQQGPPPMLRSRSASTPHVPPPGAPGMQRHGSQQSQDWGNTNPYHTPHYELPRPHPQAPNVPPLTLPHPTQTIPYNGVRARRPGDRTSASSIGSHTDRSSGDSSGRSGAMTSATSPTSPGSVPSRPSTNGFSYSSMSIKQAPGTAPPSPSSAIHIKLFVGDDSYVIVMRDNSSYNDLVEKVRKKIRLCADRGKFSDNIRLRYEDEEGDRILISADDDVTMAIEWSRTNKPPNQLILYAD